MKRSYKRAAPPSFERWKRTQEEGTGLRPTFRDLQQPERNDVRDALLKEQNFLCAYCGRRLNPDHSDSHIDHFWPQRHFSGTPDPEGVTREDRRLNHDNFFLSCGPPSLPSKPSLPCTCGDAKGDWFDECYHVMPSDPDCESKFVYGNAGGIEPKNRDDVAAHNMIDNLNLRNEVLALERKKVIQEIEREILQSDAQPGDKADQINSWCSPDRTGMMTGFAQVVRRYFEEESEPAD